MIIRTRLVSVFRAAAITAWPFIFVSPQYADDPMLLVHESIHLAQQRRWAVYGVGVGLLAWWFLYLLCLPVAFNRCRRAWETEAYRRGNGLDDETIAELLKHAPYYLV